MIDKAAKPLKVNGRHLTYQIILSKGLGKLTRYSEKMIVNLSERAINKKTYTDILDKEDAKQTAYVNILTNWQSFNPDKTINAFAYLTEIHKRATTESLNNWYNRKGLKKEEQSYVKNISINSANNGQGMHNM